MFSFSTDGRYFIKCTSDDKFLLFDTSNNSLRGEYGEKRRKHGKVSCLTYSNEKGELGTVFVGTTAGAISRIDLDTSKITIIGSGLHRSKEISDLSLSSDHKSLFSCSSFDSDVLKISIKSGKTVSIPTDSTGNTKLALFNGKFLLVAGDDIKIFDTERRVALIKLLGHATSVSLAKVLHFVNLPDDLCGVSIATMAEDDKLINIWVCMFDKSHEDSDDEGVEVIRRPHVSLSCPDVPVSMSCLYSLDKKRKSLSNGHGSVDGGFEKGPVDFSRSAIGRFLVVDSQQNSYIFDVRFSQIKKTLVKPSFSFSLADTKIASVLVDNQREVLLGAQTSSSTKCSFTRLKIKKIGKQKKDVSTFSPENGVEQPTENTEANGTLAVVEKNVAKMEIDLEPKVTILHAEQHEQVVTSHRLKRRRIDSSANGETLAQSLVPISTGKNDSTNESAVVASSSSSGLLTLLSQGLQAEDKTKLSLCLDQTTDSAIQSTLRSLATEVPPDKVLVLRRKLICYLVKTYLGRPKKNANALIWLSAAFRVFGKRMAADEEVFEALSRFYTAVNVRLKAKERLSRLSGKIKMMVAQIEDSEHSTSLKKRKKAGNDHKQNKPLVMYNEE